MTAVEKLNLLGVISRGLPVVSEPHQHRMIQQCIGIISRLYTEIKELDVDEIIRLLHIIVNIQEFVSSKRTAASAEAAVSANINQHHELTLLYDKFYKFLWSSDSEYRYTALTGSISDECEKNNTLCDSGYASVYTSESCQNSIRDFDDTTPIGSSEESLDYMHDASDGSTDNSSIYCMITTVCTCIIIGVIIVFGVIMML